jgi:hypothetical protein
MKNFLTSKQARFVEKELNKIISRCLWEPSGDPDRPLLKRAACAFMLLKIHNLRITVDPHAEAEEVLRGQNCEGEDFLACFPKD